MMEEQHEMIRTLLAELTYEEKLRIYELLLSLRQSQAHSTCSHECNDKNMSLADRAEKASA